MVAVAGPGDDAENVVPAVRPTHAWRRFVEPALFGLAALSVTAIGLYLRLDHAQTFVSEGRASDYESTVEAIQWVVQHRTTFDVASPLHNGYHGPLFYIVAALITHAGYPIRTVAKLSAILWLPRQWVLHLGLRDVFADRPGARLTALGLHAVLPISVLCDGKVYQESMHATLFAVALLFLFRIERAAVRDPSKVRSRDALFFGLAAGLAMITKSVAAILVMVPMIFYGWLFYRAGIARAGEVARKSLRPALWAVGGWLLMAGWWCGRNLRTFHHPFPHEFMYRHVEVIESLPIVGEPIFYRRPLGWFLPFEFDYLRFPYGPWSRPNFWSALISGIWTDYINRGFCRMLGGGPTHQAWRTSTPLSVRCIEASTQLVRLGLVITVATAVAAAWIFTSFVRSRGRRGAFVVPLTAALVVLFVMIFGAAYPFDHFAIVKANYALAAATPLCACFCALVAAPRRGSVASWIVAGLAALAASAVGLTVAAELWWL